MWTSLWKSGLYLTEQQQEEQPLQEEESQQEIVVISSGQQRLIPLTSEIQRAMMDFNGSQSSTSLSEKQFYNTFSITSLVREEVHNILKELTISDQFIRKEEIDDLIERCLKEKVTIVQEDDSKTTTTPSASDTNQEIEVTVEMLNENDKNKLIVENFQILEQRITNLEERISQLLQAIPKLRNASTKKFKINTEAIREELKQFMDKMDLVHVLKPCNTALQKVEQQQQDSNQQPQLQQQHGDNLSFYDQMYYEQRQHNLNLLNYKKSFATIELNKRAHLNPKIKPLNSPFPINKYEPKLRSMFLCSNN